MQDINVTIVQSQPAWKDIDTSLSLHDKMLEKAKGNIVLLPEMFQTGFCMDVEALAEKMGGKTMRWMQKQAQKRSKVIAGSYIVEEEQHFYNRLIWMQPDDHYHHYDKRHLFRMGKEHEAFKAGSQTKIVSYRGWRFCLQICYDLRFPVWSRNQNNYDCLIYAANWPQERAYHWKQLLIARAIENQSYVIGINRVGTDGNDMHYVGKSLVIDFQGNIIAEAGNEAELLEASLSLSELQYFRTKFPAWMDRDHFQIQ